MPKGRRTGPTAPRPDRSPRRVRRGRALIERVTKRDGRVVPFQVEKIRDAFAVALEAVGQPDADFAAEVAAVVELTLQEERRRDAGFVAHIEGIQDRVEQALMELGRPMTKGIIMCGNTTTSRSGTIGSVSISSVLSCPNMRPRSSGQLPARPAGAHRHGSTPVGPSPPSRRA